MILETFPTPVEFYKTYWGKKPFIVRNFISEELIESLVDGDTLAGLALEDDIKSRIITNNAAGNDWVCEHGPFDEDRFDNIGDKNWSLLVQNVEQYHTDTAALLPHFQFSPRWLMDDIMVSFSASGGSVGPHTDSYHTFLVQGIGKRTWKISSEIVDDNRYADNPDVKVLAHGFEGETFEVTAGDVIYMPPFFGHEGKTIDAAMTFSVGFLGPKISEILGEYAGYLEENETLDKRYLGANLETDSAAFTIGAGAICAMRGDIVSAIESDEFAAWLAAYFATPTHDEIENIAMREDIVSCDDMLATLQDGGKIYRPEHIKFAVTTLPNGCINLAVFGESVSIPAVNVALIKTLNDGDDLTLASVQNSDEALEIITALYNRNALSLRGDKSDE